MQNYAPHFQLGKVLLTQKDTWSRFEEDRAMLRVEKGLGESRRELICELKTMLIAEYAYIRIPCTAEEGGGGDKGEPS